METKQVTEEMCNELRKPLPPESISQHPTKTYLSTIRAIYVVERLNKVFGIGSWNVRNYEIKIEPKAEGSKVGDMVVVKSCFTVEAYGIELESYGGNNNEDLGDAYKGACTDALTKIGSYLEIGIDVFKGKGATPQTPTEATQAPQTDEGLGICDLCGSNAQMSKTGNPYCPNIKDHIAKKEKYTIVKKPTKAEEKFDKSLDESMEEINYDA